MRRRVATPLTAVLVVTGLVAMTAAPVGAGNAHGHAKHRHTDRRATAMACGPLVGAPIEVHHGPVAISLANPVSDGHQVGDLRATSVPTTDATGSPLGRLDATLTTTAVDVPAAGDEIRISTLVFTFGDEGSDQIVVGGSAVYPAQGPTLAQGSVTTRPIQGGSGRYAGALGSAVSEHLPDGSWRHTLHLADPTTGVSLAPRPRIAVLDRVRERPRALRVRVSPDRPGPDVDRSPLHDLLRALWSRLSEHDRGDVEHGLARRLERARSHRGRGPAGIAKSCLLPAPIPAPAEPYLYEGLQGAPIGEPGITRDDLGRTRPGGAPGQELGLWHYTIPVGAELPPHTHAGSQVARVIRGELTYTVIKGDGSIIGADGASRAIGPGTYVLRAGESVVEDPDLEHYGSNRGPEVVEIIAATIYPEGAPLSIPIGTPPPAASAAPPPAASAVAPPDPVATASPTPSPSLTG